MQERLGGCGSRFGGVLVDGGEGWIEVRGDGDVSDAHEGEVGGDREPQARCRVDDPDGELVAEREDRGGGWVERKELLCAFDS